MTTHSTDIFILGGFQTAGYVHRVMGFVTFCYFALHLGSIFRRVLRGEQGMFVGPSSMVPQLKDLEDMIGTIKWFFGLGPRPKYDRYTYWEKFDYWAVFWGVGMIGVSGLVLWFPTIAAKLLPGWAFNVANSKGGSMGLRSSAATPDPSGAPRESFSA